MISHEDLQDDREKQLSHEVGLKMTERHHDTDEHFVVENVLHDCLL